MHKNGAIDELKIIDIGESPEIAQQYNIRSVPYYLINGVAFHGLMTQQQIERLLQQNNNEKWQEFIKSELTEGQLDAVEKVVTQNSTARDAMMLLLKDSDTTLVVRIGLSAIIESIAGHGLLEKYESNFIDLISHQDERIAIDAIYHLSLLATDTGVNKLMEVAANKQHKLQSHAVEALQDLASEELKH